MDHHAVSSILAYLFSALVAVPLFRKLRLGAILGYLVAGIAIGPQGLKIVTEPEQALHFAEFGVVMLLFVIGLELNPRKLWDTRLQISVLGGGQLFFSALLIALFSVYVLGFGWELSILLGLTLGLSSTAFAVQLMDEQGIMGANLGRKGFAILLLQDLAVIPVLLLVRAWAPLATTINSHSVPWWVGPIAIAAVLLVGRYAINPLLKIVADSRSREVLTSASLFIVLGTAFLMQNVGFSMGMGAFLAGVLLANSHYRHQLEADIEPFKGLLLGLFFISVGMTLDLHLLMARPLLILALALLLMLLKTLVIAILVRLRGCTLREGLFLGLMLSQGGEFAFVVVATMVKLGVTDSWVHDYAVLVVGVSMALTSPLVMLFKLIPAKQTENKRAFDKMEDDAPEVIIAGLGRFGQIIARILTANRMHFTALDKDPSHVDFLRQFGNKIYFGDATRLDLLQAAGLDKARVLVVAVDDIEDSLAIIQNVQEVRPDIKLIVRAHNRFHAYRIMDFNVQFVIRETLESSLHAARETLQLLGFTESQALEKIDTFRQHDEKLLKRSFQHQDNMDELKRIAAQGRKELAELFKSDETI